VEQSELIDCYEALLIENRRLKNENKRLRKQLGIELTTEALFSEEQPDTFASGGLCDSKNNEVGKYSTPASKISLFMSLFRGRADVFARRWQNKKGLSGYSPSCNNEWRPGICHKPKGKCSNCSEQAYTAIDSSVIDSHLRGKAVIGVYPLLRDETSWFLAIDFDDENWHNDVDLIRLTCVELDIPVAVERSRSGNGAHLWFFFNQPIAASLSRRFGSSLLTYAMNKRHELNFKSYDRMFPNQDTLPKGGFGNLIALPLQKNARDQGNSEFLDEHFKPYEDQWGFLAIIKRISEEQLKQFTGILAGKQELGFLKIDFEANEEAQEESRPCLQKKDFPAIVEVIRSNMLFIKKDNISERALNQIKRLAAFRNPEFYRTQAMRMSTFGKPRIISCAEETLADIGLPRGCDVALTQMFNELGVATHCFDKTNVGYQIDVDFSGSLRGEQQIALDEMLKFDTGVLCGTTAFGKTVVAIKLIAERKVNTLIMVDRISLVEQWRDRIDQFLTINEVLQETDSVQKRRRKKQNSVVGQMGAGKNLLGGIIDIAVMQSLNRQGEISDCVCDYGMVIVDECHHISAFSFEQIMKKVGSKFVYGLTATPIRKDGLQPIIFMQCGPIRFRDDALEQAKKRPFEHYIIPRFTSFNLPLGKDEGELTIQDIYTEIINSEIRNQQITEDVIHSYEAGRNCLVLSGRTAHVEYLAKTIGKQIADVITLTGGMGSKKTREAFTKLKNAAADIPIVVIATGKYIGEGFDEPRLDTLFLAMPVSWKGTIQQYAGRLHRLYKGKNEVQIFDYVDLHVRVLEKMYNKRLSGYASLGYKAKGDQVSDLSIDIIYDSQSFFSVFSQDLLSAKREIVIVSPFITKRRVTHILGHIRSAMEKGIRVIVVSRPVDDFSDKDQQKLHEILWTLDHAGVKLVYKSNIHQKFAIIDQRLIWYGSINLLSYGYAEESIMRLENRNIAFELMKVI